MPQPLFLDETTQEVWVAVKSTSGYSIEKQKPSLSISVAKVAKLELTGVTIVDSSKSGTGRDSQRLLYKQVLQPILQHFKVEHNYLLTESRDSIREFAASLSPGIHTIILLSGDTSVNELINGLSPHKAGQIRLCIIPYGTGNSLALLLGIRDELHAVSKLFGSKLNPLNLYSIKFPTDPVYELHHGEKVRQLPQQMYFVVVFSWGFHASLVADSDTPELRRYGLERFKMAAQKNLQLPQIYNGNTTITPHQNFPQTDILYQKIPEEGDDPGDRSVQKTSLNTPAENIPGPYAYWVVTSAQRFEPTFEISPHGNILDSSMYLVSFGPQADIMNVMGQVYNKGQHISNSEVTYMPVQASQRLVLNYREAVAGRRRFCVDGCTILAPESGEFHIAGIKNYVQKWDIFVLG